MLSHIDSDPIPYCPMKILRSTWFTHRGSGIALGIVLVKHADGVYEARTGHDEHSFLLPVEGKHEIARRGAQFPLDAALKLFHLEDELLPLDPATQDALEAAEHVTDV
jgi:hypothetical protein